jgi:hypothetical protein
MTADLAYLQSITTIANRCAFDMLGDRDSCILTSFALADVLRTLGFSASPLRVEAHCFPPKPAYGVSLGWDGDGSRRKAASPGKWWGHLAVAIGRDWLCDPTLDQVNRDDWTGRAVAVPLTPEFWEFNQYRRGASIWSTFEGGIKVRHNLYHRQVGFARAGDARPSHWRPLADAIRETASRGANANV